MARTTKSTALSGASFMVLGALLIPWSAAIVTPAFPLIGPSATSSWRFLFGAVVLLCGTRPRLRRWTRHQWLGAVAFGVSLAFMNVCFYQAIARIPLGGAVAIEFLGPFLVAALAQRTLRHVSLVLLAGLGVVALTRPGSGLTLVGVAFALGAGAGWAAYVFASHRVGGTIRGFGGLAVSLLIAAILTLPFSLGSSRFMVSHPDLAGRILLVAVMSLVLGMGAEMQALRRLVPSIASVLFALNPAVAFGIGWWLLGQVMTPWDVVGAALVITASAGVTYGAAREVIEVAQ